MADYNFQREMETHRQIGAVFMQYWDPIGVAGIPAAENEYDNYISPVWRLLTSGASDAELTDYLYDVETKSMGLTRFGFRWHLRRVVARLREIDLSM